MSFLAGLDCFGQGARLARAKPLRRFVWVPMVLSFVTVSLLLVPGHGAVEAVVGWIVELLPGWLDWLGALLAFLLYVPGLLQLGFFVPWEKVLPWGLYPFIPGDLAKLYVASLLVPAGYWVLMRYRLGERPVWT